MLGFLNVLEIKYSKCVRHICRKFLVFLKTLKCLVFADMSAAIQVSVRKVKKKPSFITEAIASYLPCPPFGVSGLDI